MSERDYAEAAVQLKKLETLDPHDGWTQVQLGVVYGQSGRPEEAVHYLEPQLAAGYTDPKGAFHAMLASALRKLGREEEAKQAAKEAGRWRTSALDNENGNIRQPSIERLRREQG